MPEHSWAARGLLTGMYFLGGVAAGGSLAASLIQWAQDLNCLPPVFLDDQESQPLQAVCQGMTYSSGAVCALCVLMAISLNCCWGHWGWYLFHQTLTLCICVVSAASATTLTVDFFLWCHALQTDNHMGHTSCERAASEYDQDHTGSAMTAYFRKQEMQQVCQWAVVPIMLCAVVVLSCVMKTSTTETQRRRQPSAGRYFLLSDESSPLLVSETSLATVRVRDNQGNSVSVSG